MSVASTGQTDLAALLQQIFAAQKAQSTTSVADQAAPTGDFGPASGAASLAGPPPPKPDDGAGALLSSATLGSLIAQQGVSFSTTTDATKTGASSAASKLFSALDTNKDGTVSLDELKAALDSLSASAQASGAPPPGGRRHHHQGAASATAAASAAATASSATAASSTDATGAAAPTTPAAAGEATAVAA